MCLLTETTLAQRPFHSENKNEGVLDILMAIVVMLHFLLPLDIKLLQDEKYFLIYKNSFLTRTLKN